MNVTFLLATQKLAWHDNLTAVSMLQGRSHGHQLQFHAQRACAVFQDFTVILRYKHLVLQTC